MESIANECWSRENNHKVNILTILLNCYLLLNKLNKFKTETLYDVYHTRKMMYNSEM